LFSDTPNSQPIAAQIGLDILKNGGNAAVSTISSILFIGYKLISF
jgi:gamma-glutamyltranspeptidase